MDNSNTVKMFGQSKSALVDDFAMTSRYLRVHMIIINVRPGVAISESSEAHVYLK